MSERRNLRGRIDQELSAEPPSERAAGLERWVSPTTESAVDQVPLESIDEPEWRVPIDTSDQAYRALKSSVRASGILQPLLLRPHGEGRLQLVAGARRLQAARETMQSTVPAIIRTLGDLEALVGSWDAVLRAGATPAERESLRARLVGAGMPEADAAALLSTVPVREGAGATITTPEVATPARPPSPPAAEPVSAESGSEAVAKAGAVEESAAEPVAEDAAVEEEEPAAELVAEDGALAPAAEVVVEDDALTVQEPAAEAEPGAEEATETLVGVSSPVGPEEAVEPADEEEWREAADDAATEGAAERDAPPPTPLEEAAAESEDEIAEVPAHGPRHAAAEVHEAEEAVETLVEVPPVVGPEEPIEPEEEQEWREAAADAATESAEETAAAGDEGATTALEPTTEPEAADLPSAGPEESAGDPGAQREEPVVMAPVDAAAPGTASPEAAAPHVIPIRLPAADMALDDEPVVTAPGGGRSPVLASLPEDPVPASSTLASSAGARRPSGALTDPQNYAVLGAALFIGSVVFIIISVLLGAGGGSQLAVAIVVALVGIVTAIVSFALPQVRP